MEKRESLKKGEERIRLFIAAVLAATSIMWSKETLRSKEVVILMTATAALLAIILVGISIVEMLIEARKIIKEEA